MSPPPGQPITRVRSSGRIEPVAAGARLAVQHNDNMTRRRMDFRWIDVVHVIDYSGQWLKPKQRRRVLLFSGRMNLQQSWPR